ncbi:MAG: hypothetical protein HKN33_00250 [Pyrinomonadaceae bacterium]|nr:hypothetical protein [Pyrinomonadaceae bacterium]
MFLGSAVASLLLLALGWQIGLLNADTPDWTWITAILMIDVAHVWSTSFRTYFDREEFKSRMWLYILVPVLGYLFGVLLYSEGRMVFWRILAYIAVFHFVRQQYGWVALYRRKAGETSRVTYWIDTVTIYCATLYPLAFWMASGQRNFNWFVEGDFAQIPQIIETALFPIYVLVLLTYFAKSVILFIKHKTLTIGKDIVVITTAICWYVGIVALNSDYAFTVTNVIIHGVPYFALIYLYVKTRRDKAGGVFRGVSSNWIFFLATLWALAYIEELFWHRGVWHERGWMFGSYWDLEAWKPYLVPLLAVPQLTHYVLDGFIWKRKYNRLV